ncbi:AAA family ATPase [Botrimarina sp.]|uniref:AAA family ATPase n=1 Tax=Botrimarina sp. TaxID=2795802 RepID=UPI0032EFBEC3
MPISLRSNGGAPTPAACSNAPPKVDDAPPVTPPANLDELLSKLATRKNPRHRRACRRCWKPIPPGEQTALVSNQGGSGLTWVHTGCVTPADVAGGSASAAPTPDVKRLEDRIAKLEAAKPQRIEVKVGDAKPRQIDGVAHPELKRVLTRLALRKPVFCPGPTGSGKSFLARQAAQAIGLEFYTMSCSIGMTEGALLGRSQPEGENGSFVYTRTPFMRAYEDGGLFLLDEIDAADSGVLLCVNNAIANGFLDLPGRHRKPRAEQHPDFRIMAAANTYGRGASRMYVGRNPLDESTLDRFRANVIPVDYSRELETKLWSARGCDENLLQVLWEWRKRIETNQMERVLSTRFIEDAADLLAAGIPWKEVADSYFCGWRQDEINKVQE